MNRFRERITEIISALPIQIVDEHGTGEDYGGILIRPEDLRDPADQAVALDQDMAAQQPPIPSETIVLCGRKCLDNILIF